MHMNTYQALEKAVDMLTDIQNGKTFKPHVWYSQMTEFKKAMRDGSATELSKLVMNCGIHGATPEKIARIQFLKDCYGDCALLDLTDVGLRNLQKILSGDAVETREMKRTVSIPNEEVFGAR